MRRMIAAAALALLVLLAGTALAEEEYPQPYRDELVGTWGFNGGAEEHGDGFRLNADGTGVWLEIIDYEQVPLQYRETDSTFTWRAEYADGKTYLHETYAGGKTVTYEIETWGGARIHIPNEVSGGFYYPVLDDAAAAYLADKAEPSAFDGVIADYLDGSITGKIEATGLHVGEIYLQQEDSAWRIVIKTYDRKAGLGHRFILDEEHITVWVDDFVWLWGDFDLGQPWFAPDTTERYYASLPGILESYLTWEHGTPAPAQDSALASTPEPTPAALPELTAQLGSFPRNKTYPVYEAIIGGDDEPNRRAGNGKAKVSTNGDIWVYATWKGMLLVEYEISSGRNRIGWIDTADLPSYTLEGVPELPDSWDTEENVYGVVTADTYLTDDPHYDGLDPNYVPVPTGTSVRCLGSLGTELLVECFINHELRMGFIPVYAVVQNHGYAENAVYSIDQATRFTEQEVRRAMNAVTAFIEEEWAGTAVIELRYIEAESADPDAWWQDETGRLTGILLYADLNSMPLWDMEIGYIAEDYQFILYREDGGEWYVANYGYT